MFILSQLKINVFIKIQCPCPGDTDFPFTLEYFVVIWLKVSQLQVIIINMSIDDDYVYFGDDGKEADVNHVH